MRMRCSHGAALPVESGGETVAALCPDCDRQLPSAWLTCEHEPIEIHSFGDLPGEKLCQQCGVSYWETQPA